jgi:hypothetical protein
MDGTFLFHQMQVFAITFATVFLRGFQHKNVIGNHIRAVIVTSYLMAVCDVLFIGLLIKATAKKSKDGRGDQMTCILRDDTGEIRLFINQRNYNASGDKLLKEGPVGKTLWAVKGSTPQGGGIVWTDMVRFLGLVDQEPEEKKEEETSDA